MNTAAVVKDELRDLFANPEQSVAVWWRVVASDAASQNGMWHPCSMHQCQVDAVYHVLNLAYDYQVMGIARQHQQRGEACSAEFRVLAGRAEVIIATPAELDFVFDNSLNPRGRKPTPSTKLKALMTETVPA